MKKILKVSQTYGSFSKFHYGRVIDHPFDRNFYAWTLTHEPTLTENLQKKFSRRVMLGAFPLIIPNDPVMKMKIEEKAMSLMKKA